MSEYQERRTVIENVPTGRRAVVEHGYETHVHEPRGMSVAAIAAIVIALIAAAVLITFMIVSANQRSREDDLAHQRDQAEAAARAAQSANQQPNAPPVVVMPQQPPAAVPVPVPVPSASQPAPSTSEPAVSDTSIEVNVTSKLLDDEDLRPHPINVKVSRGTATLSGEVPSEDLKTRAEELARTVKGVRHVVNNLTVHS